MASYVVTGANRGIGLEFIRQLSKNTSNTVIGLVRSKAASQDLVEHQKAFKNVHIYEADITDVAALKAAAREVAILTGGSLDVLINNAALVPTDRIEYTIDGYPEGEERLLEADYLQLFNINVLGVIHTINSFLPLLRVATSGGTAKVISLSSGVGDLDFTLAAELPISVPYSISKAALNMAVVKYAVKYKHQGIVFLAISPGLVNTSPASPTPEPTKQYLDMIHSFQRVAPNWDGKPITPEESVQLMLRVVDGLHVEDSGSFVSQFGSKQWL